MCFSAPASFIASGIFVIAGVKTSQLKKSNLEIPFSLIPFIFAFQQFIEGFVWLGISEILPYFLIEYLGHIFLFFALIFWPVFIPFTILVIEKNKKRKLLIMLFQILGLLIGVYLGTALMLIPLKIYVNGGSIIYEMIYPGSRMLFYNFLYLFTIAIPFFITSRKNMKLIGVLILLSFSLAKFLTLMETIISVWCFFGALISLAIFYNFKSLHVKN